MLTITDDQLRSFDRDKLHKIDPKIDSWLVGQHPHWAKLAPQQRQRILYDMVEHGYAAGMAAETDYALYCDLMVRIGPNWQQFARCEDAREIVEDPAANPAMKLDDLTELATEQAEDGAR